MFDGSWARVECENLCTFAEEINEIATVAAAGVENAHAGRDVAAKDLIEDVDVDFAEQFLDGGWHGWSVRF